MRIDYDPKVDAVYITFRKGRVKKTVELAPEVNLDLDSKGRPLYLVRKAFGFERDQSNK